MDSIPEVSIERNITHSLCVFGSLFLIYFIGYAGCSFAWVILGLVFYAWRQKREKGTKRMSNLHKNIHENAREALLATVKELPSWVTFPDVERAEWINKIIYKFWPYVNGYLKEWCMTSLQDNIQITHPALSTFTFTGVELGDVPPRVAGVKVYSDNTQRDELYIDLDLRFCSASILRCKIKGIPLGVQDLQICGTLRLVFKPLIQQMPLFGCLNIFYLENPTVDFNLKYAANMLNIPGLDNLVRNIIIENIAWILVSPSRIAIPMQDGVNLKVFKYPPPEGVIRLTIIEARDLINADTNILGRGSSDPYVIIKVGVSEYKTRFINNNRNPEWNETFEVFIDTVQGLTITMDIYDYDPNSRDDPIGSAQVEVVEIAESRLLDLWLPLSDVKQGNLHVRGQWLYIGQNPLLLKQIDPKHDKESNSILLINLDSAHDMPHMMGKEVIVGKYINMNKKKKSQQVMSPVVHCTLSVGQCKQETWERQTEFNSNPVWEQNFRFLVQNPHVQNLELHFTDLHHGKSLGELTLPLKLLLAEPNLTVDTSFKLEKSGEDSKVVIRASLRILTTEYTENNENLYKLPTENYPVDFIGSEATVRDSAGLNNQDIAIQPEREEDFQDVNIPTSDTTIAENKPYLPEESKDFMAKDYVKEGKHETKEGNKGQQTDKNTNKEKEQIQPPSSSSKKNIKITPSTTDTDSLEVSNLLTLSAVSMESIVSQCTQNKEAGKIQMTLNYDKNRKKFITIVHSCQEISVDQTGGSNVYVKVFLMTGLATNAHRKTTAKKNNGNPVFQEMLEFPGTVFCKSKHLKIKVKQKRNGKVLGSATIDTLETDLKYGTPQWFDLHC